MFLEIRSPSSIWAWILALVFLHLLGFI
ncbi:PLDc N-terminal domain-containing protein [Staphylococcus aureus]